MASILDRVRNAWSVFVEEDSRAPETSFAMGPSYSTRPDRPRMMFSADRTITSALYTRMSLDAAGVRIRHARVDEDDRYLETIRTSGLNECLTVEANIDQAARAFRQDIFLTLFDKGVVAIVPVETSISPLESGGYDIRNLRVGYITAWYPRHVTVNLWNDRLGRREEVTVPKELVAIVENPLYSVMNEPNSTLQRLIRKLNLLDAVDEQSGSGKLDLIIQLPYTIRSDARREQAEKRRKDIEGQLKDSQYGIAYSDATEKITQLNRPAENNMMKQVEYLTTMLYGQLGITEEIMSGTADEATMLNYYNRTIEPLLTAVTEEMKRKFLTKTARTQGQSVIFVQDPFKMVPLSQIAEIGDKFARNEIMTANEIRPLLGLRPSKDPKADKLMNSNMPQALEAGSGTTTTEVDTEAQDAIVEETFASLESSIDELIGGLDNAE